MGMGEELPTYASEEAALIAEVGDCCKGLNPFCTVKCLIEVAMEKRAAILAKRDEADRKQAESVLASFNLARHALAGIHELIELGDPWRNPEVLDQIKYAVEDALALAEKHAVASTTRAP